MPHGSDEVNLEIDDTRGLEPAASDGRQPPLLVLSRDGELVETVKKAAPRGSPVEHAPDLDHVAEQLSGLRPGVLVVDTASTSDVPGMVAQLTQHFPDLVVVVAGKREDSSSLMQLTAAGRIFRFLLTPLSHGQTRLALEAAVTQHLDLLAAGERLSSASGDAAGGGKNYVVTYGALALGLLLVISGIWFGVSRFTGEPPTPAAVQPAAPPEQEGSLPEKPDPVKAELALAKEAFDQGRYLEPAGESALDLYRSALALDPNNVEARAGVRSVVDKVLERAEAALLGERLEEAIRNIEMARDIDAAHPRLAFMDAQIARERERLQLTQAQEVGNRVRALVAQANARMSSGRLITPSGASARDALLEARRLDPTDPTVAQGVRQLAGLLATEARNALDANDAQQARTYVNAARDLGSAGAALAAIERSLSEAARSAAPSAPAPRQGQASGTEVNVQAMAADVRQRIMQGKLIDPPGDSARDMLNKLSAAAPDIAEVEELSRVLTVRLLDMSKQASAAKAFDRAGQLIAAAHEVGSRYESVAISQAERELAAAREVAASESVISAAGLKRTRTVNPEYPDSARRRGIEGWVEVAFTITPTGAVEDVEVRNASPADVFDDAAVRAMRQWRFEPIVRNGERVSQRAMLRLRFAQQQ
jgi:TonB family protein